MSSSLHQTRLEVFQRKVISCIGTEWHHGARLPGVGLDCVGLIAKCAIDSGYKCYDLLNYSKYPDGDTLISMLRDNLVETAGYESGNILVFTFNKKRVPQHIGVLTDSGLVHAWQSVGAVVRHDFDDKWRKLVTHVFQLGPNRWLP